MEKLKISRLIGMMICQFLLLNAHSQEFNYDESKVKAYVLPQILKSKSGKTIKNKSDWESSRRLEILELFKENVYGKMPKNPAGMHFEVTSLNENALGGKAIMKEVTLHFSKVHEKPNLKLLLFIPKNTAQKPAVFCGLNYWGNQSVHKEKIAISTNWVRENEAFGIVNNKATEKTVGIHAYRWQVDSLINAGFAVATAFYGDLESDKNEGWETGVRGLLRNETGLQANEWGAIGVWAWGLSRMLDYIETEPILDAKKVIVHGHSRLGKAALWAAANDTRFAAAISNCSGESGAALARRNYGETIKRISNSFPYWFIEKYKDFATNPNLLPVDQHQLLALIAPRPLYVASAVDDQWADPRGEFLSLFQLGEVYRLYGKPTLKNDTSPEVNQPIGSHLRYHIRTGKHDITHYDWVQYLDFGLKEVSVHK